MIHATMYRHMSLRIIVSPWKQFCFLAESPAYPGLCACEAVVVASPAASAQAFDAGGRRFDIWVGDMTQEEATEMLEKHGRESYAAEIIDNCALAWNASGFCHAVFSMHRLVA